MRTVVEILESAFISSPCGFEDGEDGLGFDGFEFEGDGFDGDGFDGFDGFDGADVDAGAGADGRDVVVVVVPVVFVEGAIPVRGSWRNRDVGYQADQCYHHH
jgi:hypothetical protein